MFTQTENRFAFMKPFVKKLDINAQDKIFKENPVGFLFEDGRIPASYVNFLKRINDEPILGDDVDWVREEDGKYYIVTEDMA